MDTHFGDEISRQIEQDDLHRIRGELAPECFVRLLPGENRFEASRRFLEEFRGEREPQPGSQLYRPPPPSTVTIEWLGGCDDETDGYDEC